MAAEVATNLVHAIKPPKLEQIHYSNELNHELAKLVAEQASNRAANAADLALLSDKAKTAAGQVEGLSAGDQATIAQIIAGRQDPFQTFTGVGNYKKSFLDDLSANLAVQGKAGLSRQDFALGYGGRGPSTYTNNSLFNNISQNLAPVYANALSSVGSDARGIDAGRLAQNQDIINMINYRAGIPFRAVDAYSVPLQIRQNINANNISDLNSIGNAYRTNYAGSMEKESALGYLGRSADSVYDTALAAYSAYMGQDASKTAGGAPKQSSSPLNTNSPGGQPGGGQNYSNMYGGNGMYNQSFNPGASGYDQYGMSYGQAAPQFGSSSGGYSAGYGGGTGNFPSSGFSDYGVGYSKGGGAASGAWTPGTSFGYGG